MIPDIALLGLGVYIPRYRLAGEQLAQVWGGATRRGVRAVANYDEDALTMAAAAAADALERAPGDVGAVFFASCTAPYQEKLHAAILTEVLHLDRNVRAVDFGPSPRAAAAALDAAADAIHGHPDKRVLLIFADSNTPEPGGDAEGTSGDGAVAFILGATPPAAPIAWLVGSTGVTEDFPDHWRRPDSYAQGGDVRFVQTLGYERLGREVVEALLAEHGVTLADVAHFAIAVPDERSCRGIERAIGIQADRCVGHAMLTGAGYTGVAAMGLALAAALEHARPQAPIVSVCFGGGAQALLWRVGEGVQSVHDARPLTRELRWMRRLEHYGRYLQARAYVGDKLVPFSSPIMLWRDRRYNLGLTAQRCRRCGAIEFPVGRVCGQCHAKDELDDVPLSHNGRVFTFTHDHLMPTADPPTTMAIVDLDGGGRFYCQLTDCPPEAVRIGMPGKLALRRLHEGGGTYNYFWKLRPLPPQEL
jgi:hydroxymethylglutaryl-CoA synthase